MPRKLSHATETFTCHMETFTCHRTFTCHENFHMPRKLSHATETFTCHMETFTCHGTFTCHENFHLEDTHENLSKWFYVPRFIVIWNLNMNVKKTWSMNSFLRSWLPCSCWTQLLASLCEREPRSTADTYCGSKDGRSIATLRTLSHVCRAHITCMQVSKKSHLWQKNQLAVLWNHVSTMWTQWIIWC